MHQFLAPYLVPYLRIEYFLVAWFEYICFWLKGQNWKRRLKLKFGSWPKAPVNIDKLAIFAAYHGKRVSLSNLAYLRCLNNSGFNVVYIHNGPLSEEAINDLSGLCLTVFERINLGQDWGSFKDAFLNLRRFGWLVNVKWLLFCNDSVHFLGDSAGDIFAERFKRELIHVEEPVVGLNENQQPGQHLQSFFVAVRNEVFNSKYFVNFWKSYIPLSHRFHAISKGEVRWSLKVLNRFPRKVLYTPTDIANFASSSFEDEQFLGISRLLIPKCCASIVDNLKSNLFEDINSDEDRKRFPRIGGRFTTSYVYWDQLILLSGILESTNTSHSCALMFCALLGSPFLKKDICKHNTYSLSQLNQFLDYFFSSNVDDSVFSKSLMKEIISSFQYQGGLVSYLSRPRFAYRKGLFYRGFGIAQESLPNYGNR
jgi:hypothetical protein